jgi:hypothetical protein
VERWFQIGESVKTGKTQTHLMGMVAHRVQQKIDRELREAEQGSGHARHTKSTDLFELPATKDFGTSTRR